LAEIYNPTPPPVLLRAVIVNKIIARNFKGILRRLKPGFREGNE
jgi:hypothetical protein